MTRVYVQVFRFLLVGCINTLAGLTAIYGLMYWTNLNPMTANAIGFIIGVVISYSLNKGWTFESKATLSSAIPKYILSVVLCYGANISALSLLIYAFNTNIYAAQLGGIATYTVLMFIICRLFVFRSAPNPPNLREKQ